MKKILKTLIAILLIFTMFGLLSVVSADSENNPDINNTDTNSITNTDTNSISITDTNTLNTDSNNNPSNNPNTPNTEISQTNGGITPYSAGGPESVATVIPNTQDVFINSSFRLNVTFVNQGNETGYQPMMQLIVPAGITLTSASYAGLTLNINLIGTFTAANNYTLLDPLAGLNVTLGPSYENYTLYNFEYPIGSIPPYAPPLSASIFGNLGSNVSLGVPVNI